MIEVPKQNARFLEKYFSYTNMTMLLSFTHGHMGCGWADALPEVGCAQVVVGDVCFVAGDCDSPAARRMVRNVPAAENPWLLFIPQNDAWGALIEREQRDNYEKFLRYAIRKEPGIFSRDLLRSYAERLPEGMSMAAIDGALYRRCLQIDSMRDFCSQFDSAADYAARGLGFCVLHDGEIVCGASSYTVYDGGIEIEVATARHFRRRGLAAACAARLMLACLDRGLYPSWDAANLPSVALAQKLGYRFDRSYITYAVVRPRTRAA